MGEIVNLSGLADTHRFDAKITREESPEERTSRLARDEADARIERWIRFITFLALLLGMFVVAGLAIYLLLRDASDEKDRTWAASILTGLFTGSVAFVAGQKTARSR